MGRKKEKKNEKKKEKKKEKKNEKTILIFDRRKMIADENRWIERTWEAVVEVVVALLLCTI